jgi:hypothetical protein
MSKFIVILVSFFSLSAVFSQDIKLTEETHYFIVGSKNALVINIPYGNKDIVEKQLRKELKDWGGKYDTEKGEFRAIQASTKFMGSKPFDAYVKIIVESDQSIKIAFGFDLGGAFMTSREHGDRFKPMSDRLLAFARETSLTCIDEELDLENKNLSSFEKDQKTLEKDKEKLLEDIEDYKKKIVAAERKIETNLQEQNKAKDEIKRQKEKISDIEKKKKSLK